MSVAGIFTTYTQGSRPPLAERSFPCCSLFGWEPIPEAKLMPEAQEMLLGCNAQKLCLFASLPHLVGASKPLQKSTSQVPLPQRKETLFWHLLLLSRKAASGQEGVVWKGRQECSHINSWGFWSNFGDVHTDFWSSLKLMKGLYMKAYAVSETSVILVQKLSLSYKTSQDDLRSHTWVSY